MLSHPLESVRKVYRQLYRLVPADQRAILRESFVKTTDEPLAERLKQAESRLSFLRMTTVKTKPRGESGRWVYRDGKKLETAATPQSGSGRVVSNWDGNNMDPESVKRHQQTLKRAGFVNNAHAKGVF